MRGEATETLAPVLVREAAAALASAQRRARCTAKSHTHRESVAAQNFWLFLPRRRMPRGKYLVMGMSLLKSAFFEKRSFEVPSYEIAEIC